MEEGITQVRKTTEEKDPKKSRWNTDLQEQN